MGMRNIPWREMDEDGALVSVPNTGLYVVVYTYIPNNRFQVDYASVNLYDAAALALVKWRVARNGNVINKLDNLRTFSFQGAEHQVRVSETLFPLEVLTVEALVPVAAGVAFDVVARLTGKDLRQ